MQSLAAFAKKIGLNNPNEKTVQTLVAIAIGARVQSTRVEVPAEDRLACVRLFKDFLRALPFEYEGPKQYPSTPDVLREEVPGLYAHAYSNEGAGEPVISDRDLMLELQRTPCRKTRDCPETQGAMVPLGGVRSWNKLPRSAFASVLGAFQRHASTSAFEDREIRGLRIFETPRPSEGRDAGASLVLMNGPNAPPPLCDGSPHPLNAIADGPPEPSNSGSPPTPGSSPTVHVIPAPRRCSGKTSPPGATTSSSIDTSVEGMLQNLQSRPLGAKAKAKGAPKAKAKSKAAPKTNGNGEEGKRKSALLLGCSKCRFLPKGCGVCRNPSFSGKRGRPGCSKCRFLPKGCGACRNPSFSGKRGHPDAR